MDIEEFVDQTDDFTKSPIAWFNMAEDLHHSAKTLWLIRSKRVLVVEVYSMLCGMAIESLYKSIIVMKTHEQAKTIHKLVTLSGDAGLKVNDKDKMALEILTQFIEWGGRYPYSKNPQGRSILYSLFDEYIDKYAPESHQPHGWEFFNNLWTPAMDVYARILKKTGEDALNEK